jgi:coenzyme F420-reducing hydrogenase beta subunit
MPDNTEKYQTYKAQDEAKIEQDFLRGQKEEDLGVYCDMFSAKSSIEGQDGGVVTALLVKGFEVGFFDSASCSPGKVTAEAVVATNASGRLLKEPNTLE